MITAIKNIIKKKLHKSKIPKDKSYPEKFKCFQLLLESNDNAHQRMSDLADMLALGKPFSKGYANHNYNELVNETKKTVEYLSELADGHFQGLIKKVEILDEKCRKILSPRIYCPEGWVCPTYECTTCDKVKKVSDGTPYPYDISEIDDSLFLEVGSKMSRLGEIRNKLNIPVPNGFCLTYRFFEQFMLEGNLRSQIDNILKFIDFNDISQIQKASHEIQTLLVSTAISGYIQKIIYDAWDWSFPNENDVKVAVRSSAIGEDSIKYSFAGLHQTLLNIGRDNVVDAAWDVLASKYSPQSLVYRYINGLRDEDMPMSVGCIKMIDATVSGVLFTNDPIADSRDDNNKSKNDTITSEFDAVVHDNETIVIQAIRGLGTLLVEGKVIPQEFKVGHNENASIISFKEGVQEFYDIVKTTDGITRAKINDDLKGNPLLSQSQIKKLVNYALIIEKHFGCPQDIEWAFDKTGKLFILQARPLIIKKTIKTKKIASFSIDSLLKKYPLLIDGGDCASHGMVIGKAIKINNIKELADFPKGGILVTKKNLPELASILHKAAGVISDIGSTTGHLSIIARELEIPVLTNIGNATSKIMTNTDITLLADEKKVFLGRIPEVENHIKEINSKSIDDAFRKTPLYNIWHQIGKMIFKLNLIDPNSSKFNPNFCDTFHDIIRFTHETAMQIMFSMYDAHHVAKGSSYKLKFNVPLDIHIIDLGNTLPKDLKGYWVTPEEIDSKPFVALVNGMRTPGVQWSGYLHMDTKGLASVILGSIVDTNRDRDMGSTSYAFISSNYVNFFSRLGYHFSRLDAFASDEINSNYINFNFRGGASDLSRRSRRAIVIKRILEHLNFTAIAEEDNVIANIRKVPEQEIYRLLSELGRLMGAIRNVDVTLTSESFMDEFVNGFIAGEPAPAKRYLNI